MKKQNVTKGTSLAVGILFMVLAYVLGSIAIDTGRLLHYFLVIVVLGLGLKYLIIFLKSYGKK